MTSYTRRRRREFDQENPGWPGLVDLFAFAMVITLLLWAQSTVPPPTPPPIAGPQGEGARIEPRLQEIEQRLKSSLGDLVESVRLERNPHRVEVRTRIRFDTQEYRLDAAQIAEVSEVASRLLAFLRVENDTLLSVSGKADPRRFQSPAPPRDNVELSALRAAEVSRAIFGQISVVDVRDRVSVRGLGDTHNGVPVSGNDEELGRLRTVTFDVYVDATKLPRDASTPAAAVKEQ